MFDDPNHVSQLADTLRNRLVAHLDKTVMVVVPPGTLGAGMGCRQETDLPVCDYDPEAGTLTITATVRVSMYRKEPDKAG